MDDDPRLETIRDEIWTLLEDGDSEAAASAALRALTDYGEAPELRYLLGVALLDVDEPAAALAELERAAHDAPDWADAHSALAWAQFRLCRFRDAERSVRRALELDPSFSETHQLRGLLAERAGDGDTALAAFAEARRLDPEQFPEPFEMDEGEFLEIAQITVAELDEETRDALEETAFFVQPFPSEELLLEGGDPLDPQLLGLFVGRSLLEASVQDSGMLPNTMYLFQNNLQRTATTRDELEDEIRVTVLHEIGHHFGWDEEELAARGLA
jgi:predicted Zn-dependent protease with MMP-like domain